MRFAYPLFSLDFSFSLNGALDGGPPMPFLKLRYFFPPNLFPHPTRVPKRFRVFFFRRPPPLDFYAGQSLPSLEEFLELPPLVSFASSSSLSDFKWRGDDSGTFLFFDPQTPGPNSCDVKEYSMSISPSIFSPCFNVRWRRLGSAQRLGGGGWGGGGILLRSDQFRFFTSCVY